MDLATPCTAIMRANLLQPFLLPTGLCFCPFPSSYSCPFSTRRRSMSTGCSAVGKQSRTILRCLKSHCKKESSTSGTLCVNTTGMPPSTSFKTAATLALKALGSSRLSSTRRIQKHHEVQTRVIYLHIYIYVFFFEVHMRTKQYLHKASSCGR